MPKFKTVEECFSLCQAEGFLQKTAEINTEKIKTNLNIAQEDLASAQDSIKSKRWNSAYKSFYDALHLLAESYISFDNLKSSNYQCLFAYLCMKHKELEFSWDFF